MVDISFHGIMVPEDKNTQSVPGGKVNILGGHSIGHSKQRKNFI